jgi:hypothetical protein
LFGNGFQRIENTGTLRSGCFKKGSFLGWSSDGNSSVGTTFGKSRLFFEHAGLKPCDFIARIYYALFSLFMFIKI